MANRHQLTARDGSCYCRSLQVGCDHAYTSRATPSAPDMRSTTSKGGAKAGARTTAVDEYLARVPAGARATLEKLRRDIKAVIPTAAEVISYQVPAFKQGGKLVVSFGASKAHCSFYVMSPEVMRAHASELEDYDTSKGTVRFPPDEPLPATLVRKLVRARVAENAKNTSSTGARSAKRSSRS